MRGHRLRPILQREALVTRRGPPRIPHMRGVSWTPDAPLTLRSSTCRAFSWGGPLGACSSAGLSLIWLATVGQQVSAGLAASWLAQVWV